MNKKIIAVAVVVLAIGIGAFFLMKNKSDGSAKTTTDSVAQLTVEQNKTSDTPSASTITYSVKGFNLSANKVKSGDSITVSNTSSSDLQMESDPHPAHTDDTDLNVGLVASGKSKTFTVSKKGTFGFHNHFDSSKTGTLIIE